MGLYAMLTQLAIDSEWTGPVNLAPKGHIRVQNGAEGVMPICQEHRAAPICPNQEHRHCQSCQTIADTEQILKLIMQRWLCLVTFCAL